MARIQIRTTQRVACALLAIAAETALAHHSIAPFDVDRTVTLNATVTGFEWANPHVYIELETRDDAGTATRWMIEAGPPNLMSRSGWSKESLEVGESVTAIVHPLRNGDAGTALGNSIRKQGGTVLAIRETALPTDLATPEAESLAATDDIFGRWVSVWDLGLAGRFLSPASEWPANGWPVTEAGRAAIESYDVTQNPSKECNLEKPPFAMIWPGLRDIETDGEIVRIRAELAPDRIIHLNVDDHDGAEYTPDGHSIGRFEGSTLVVDTTHFEAHRRGLAQGLPSSRQKHLVERFELDASGTEMAYQFSVVDWVYLTEPMTGTIRLSHRPDLALESLECDPEIASRYIDYE